MNMSLLLIYSHSADYLNLPEVQAALGVDLNYTVSQVSFN